MIAQALRAKLRIPVVAAPMFIVSGPRLVIAQCEAGIVGSLPALNARPAEQLDDWLAEIGEALGAHGPTADKAAPYAVNLIVHRSNVRLAEDLARCVKHKVPIVITSLGAQPEVYDAVHAYGGIVFHDVIHNRHAYKAVEKGADGLIAVAAGAGGHAGTLSPFALMQEIRHWFDGPLLLSGAIANGGAILAARAMGADFAYIGSPFIASEEANAVEGYKRMIVESNAADIVYTNLFTGVYGNYLRGSVLAQGLDPDNLAESDQSKMDFSSASTKAWKDIWGCGQGIGAVKAVMPAGELVDRLEREFDNAKARIEAL